MSRTAWTCDLGRVPYEPTADLQRALRDARERGVVPDTIMVLEHEPVITTGYRTEPHEVAYALTTDVPVVPTERGGKATYHGPGQVVAYPILDLQDHGADIRMYVRRLEQALIDTLARCEVDSARRDGYPGVWAGDCKVASIGVRVTRWVSFHGIALNVDCDLAPFGWFTPCGIPDVRMTSIRAERGEAAPGSEQVQAWLLEELASQFDLEPTSLPADRLEAACQMSGAPA